MEIVRSIRIGEGRDVAVLAPCILTCREGRGHDSTTDPFLRAGARNLVIRWRPVGAARKREHEELAFEGLRAPRASNHVHDAKLGLEPARLVALGHVPGPLEAGLGIVGGDRIGRERKACAVAGDSAVVLKVGLTPLFLRGLLKECGRSVVAEAGSDLESLALEEEAIPLLPERRREIVFQHLELAEVDDVARVEGDRRSVLADGPATESSVRSAGVRGRKRPGTGLRPRGRSGGPGPKGEGREPCRSGEPSGSAPSPAWARHLSSLSRRR